MMHQLSVLIFLLNFFFLSVLAAPISLDQPLIKRTTGTGTWFYDGLGACGEYNVNSDSIVALSAQIYDSGVYCGLWVSVTNTANGQSAYGMVRDECQACGPNDLDMSIGLFQQLGNLNTGVLPIDWNFMPQGWSP